MNCIRKTFIIIMMSVVIISQSSAKSDLTIDITNGVISAIPIGIIGFDGAEFADSIAEVVKNDLRSSGMFNVLNRSSSKSISESFNSPSLWEWKHTNGTIVSCGMISTNGDTLKATVRVFDVDTGRMKELIESANNNNWRLLGHRIANAIYKLSTGNDGYFDTKIVYAMQTGKTIKDKTSQIVIMDQDGTNCRTMTPKSYMAFTPCFSNDGKWISFISIKGYNKARIHIMDAVTGEDKLISIDGIGISPRFSMDNRKLMYGVAKNGTTSLYIYDLSSHSVRAFNNTIGNIDVSPSFAPDGNNIVFSSDRSSKYPKLHIMNIHSGNVSCISSDVGGYYSPSYSPDGKWIAFIKKVKGSYYLGVCKADGTGERLIIKGHVIDYPSWSPNGDMIICAIQDYSFGPFKIFRINVTGHGMSLVKPETKGSANTPYWGSKIK